MNLKRSAVGALSLAGSMITGHAIAEQFTIAVLPDTQYLVEDHPDVFLHQINWLISEQAERNIIYVAQLGDLKNDRFCDIRPTTNPETGEGTDPNDPDYTEWDLVDYGYRKLDHAGIPYGVLPGNHDFDEIGNPTQCPRVRTTTGGLTAVTEGQNTQQDSWTTADYDSLFAPTTPRMQNQYWYGDPNASDPADVPGNRLAGTNLDNFTLFEHCGIGFVAVNLAYRELAYMVPGGQTLDEVLAGTEIEWVDNKLADYPNRIGLLTSHTFAWDKNPGDLSEMDDFGAQLYNRISDNDNLMLMLSAHRPGEAWVENTRIGGASPVHVQMVDYQHLNMPDPQPTTAADFATMGTGDATVHGDSGFLRLFVFDTATGLVTIETLAPRPNPNDATPGDLLDPNSYIEIVSNFNPATSNAGNPSRALDASDPGTQMGIRTTSSGATFSFTNYPPGLDTSCATGGDIVPNGFAFTDQPAAAETGSAFVESNAITVAGINGPAPLGLNDSDGGQYSIDAGAWRSGPTTVQNGQSVRLRLPRPATVGTPLNARLTIGGISDTFSVTTQAQPTFIERTASRANDVFVRFLGPVIDEADINELCADGDGCDLTLTHVYGATTTVLGPCNFTHNPSTNQYSILSSNCAVIGTGTNNDGFAQTIFTTSASANCWFSDWDSSTASGVPDRNNNFSALIQNSTATNLTCTFRIDD